MQLSLYWSRLVREPACIKEWRRTSRSTHRLPTAYRLTGSPAPKTQDHLSPYRSMKMSEFWVETIGYKCMYTENSVNSLTESKYTDYHDKNS